MDYRDLNEFMACANLKGLSTPPCPYNRFLVIALTL